MDSFLNGHNLKSLCGLFFTLISCCVFAQNPSFDWVVNAGGSDQLGSSGTVVDSLGHIYTTGYFRGTVDFDPSDEVFELTSAGDRDMFVQKLDQDGAFLWVRRIGGSGLDWGSGIAIDMDLNVCITGFFEGAIDIDPTNGFTSARSEGNRDAFILKLGTAGNFLWGQSLGSSNVDYGLAVTFDHFNNICATGYFSDTVDFDPGDETFELTSNGLIDIYVLKLDKEGKFIWAVQLGGNRSDRGLELAADALGNVILTGVFNLDVDFDPSNEKYVLSSKGSEDIFVMKLDEAGAFVWVNSFGGVEADWSSGMVVDNDGNVYVTGYFNGDVNFNQGNDHSLLSSIGESDVYVLKLNKAGEFQWVSQFGGTGTEQGRALAVDDLGHVIVAGHFEASCDFDPGPEELNLTSNGERDIFITKLNRAGNLLWASGIGGQQTDLCFGLALNNSNAIHLSGSFQATMDFDPGVGEEIFTAVGGQDLYVLKLKDQLLDVNNAIVENQYFVYPNPTTGIVMLDLVEAQGDLEVSVFNLNGRLCQTQKLSSLSPKLINLVGPRGMYLLSVKSDQGTLTLRVVKE